MDRERIQILVEVDIDPIPGWGNDPQDYVKMLEKALWDRISHYNPAVRSLGDNEFIGKYHQQGNETIVEVPYDSPKGA